MSADDPSQARALEAVPVPSPRQWPERMTHAARYTIQWVARPRVRLSLTGVLLLAIGGLFVTNSVWTLPIVVVGALMVVVAWIGHRLDGRLAVEWGETGTEVSFRATIRSAAAAQEDGQRTLPSEEAVPPAPEAPPGALEDGGVIEGEAHTVEIDVAELKALIAAAQSTASPGAAAPVGDIRVRRIVDGARSSQPAR